jgi:hypothetical protein
MFRLLFHWMINEELLYLTTNTINVIHDKDQLSNIGFDIHLISTFSSIIDDQDLQLNLIQIEMNR